MRRFLKASRLILSIVLVLAIFLGSFLGSYIFFGSKSTQFDDAYLAVFDDEARGFYLQKADAGQVFYVDYDGDAAFSSMFTLLDQDGNNLSADIGKTGSGQYSISPPSGGYGSGKRYTLNLNDGAAFSGDGLSPARSLTFFVDKDPVEHYRFTDDVIAVPDPIDALSDTDTLIQLPDGSFQPGDIIFGQNDGAGMEYAAYRIESILDDGSAEVLDPALDEIYSELEIYGEYIWSVEDIVASPGLEIAIIENIKQSSFFDSLMMTAYAGEITSSEPGLNVSLAEGGSPGFLDITITIKLEPGENGLFNIPRLQNQSVTLTLSASTKLTARMNCQSLWDWDVSSSMEWNYSWKVDAGLYSDSWNVTDLRGLLGKSGGFIDKVEYKKDVEKIIKALDKIARDSTSGDINLFDWAIPIPSVPGLYFDAEVNLFMQLSLAVNLSVAHSNRIIHTVGLCFTGSEFSPYYNKYTSNNGVDISLRGKASAKAGINLEIKAVVISDKFANITLKPEAGLYMDLFVTWPVTGTANAVADNFIYSYFEPGIYVKANISAYLNLLVKKFSFSKDLAEEKLPIQAFTLGNKKIACGVTPSMATVRAVNNVVTAPDIIFEYYNVTSGSFGTDILSMDKVKFTTSDNTVLTASGQKLTLPSATTSGDVYVTASYLHTDNINYSTVFRVIISGSIIEGAVSAYDENQNTSALSGASVRLYAADDSSAPIDSTTTDGEGKFSFRVSQGTYRLVISADGYKQLTSTQVVGENETKYTEHILLIDEDQTGNGTAAGKITNAMTGRGLSGVDVRLREEWNNTGGAYVNFNTTTNSSGQYTVADIPAGYYTVEASLNGYVTGYANIIVMTDNPRTDFDFSITPELSDDEIRVVLTWGASPSDLDSHLIGLNPAGGSFNVYYQSKVYRYDGTEMANLDVDDTSSYGPETVTILENIYGTCTYAVHDYTNRSSTGSTSLSYSDAVVKIYRGSLQLTEYHVPTGQTGTYWTVFTIDENYNILPVNSISNTKPSS